MLQLVYYAPPHIARLALELLPAIRSAAIVPELISIVEDDGREMWQRIYSLRAIAETPGEWYLPQLKHYFLQQLIEHEIILKHHPEPDQAFTPPDLLKEIGDIAANHTVNREWYFAAFDETESITAVVDHLTTMIHFEQPEDFRIRLFGCLLDLLDAHPEELDKPLIQSLVFIDNPTIRDWLDRHLEDVAIILQPYDDLAVVAIAEQWEELQKHLINIDPDFELMLATSNHQRELQRQNLSKQIKTDLPDILRSQAYLHVDALYKHAKQGDEYAYGRLTRLARNPDTNVALRTLATHFIGKLSSMYDTYRVITHLSKYGHTETPEQFTGAPICYEAVKALLDFPIAATWETLVESYFIHPSNDLAWYLSGGIHYMTDVLSNDIEPIERTQHDNLESNWWFRVLGEISAKELEDI